MTPGRLLKLEWVSVLYLALFVLAVLTPRMIRTEWFGLEEVQVEELLIFSFGVVGLITFSLYERLMERRDQERAAAIQDRDKTRQELVSSYAYIGTMNRQMELLKEMTNETAVSLVEKDRVHKDLFQSLAAGAASIVQARHATIRVVELDALRTVREFHAVADAPVSVPNKELYRVHEEGKPQQVLRDDHGADVLVIPSDRHGATSKAFLLIPIETAPAASEQGVLKVYANQAELLHDSLERRNAPTGALALVAHAERQSMGEIS